MEFHLMSTRKVFAVSPRPVNTKRKALVWWETKADSAFAASARRIDPAFG
jgi:hypothetical protein